MAASGLVLEWGGLLGEPVPVCCLPDSSSQPTPLSPTPIATPQALLINILGAIQIFRSLEQSTSTR